MADIAADLYSRTAGIDIHQSLAVVSVIVPVGDGFPCRFVRGEFDIFIGQGLKVLVSFPAPFGVEIVLMEVTVQ